MNILIWPGAIISLIGVFGLIYCVRAAAKARKEGLDDEAMRKRLQSLVAINMATLAVSAIGLMMVVVGILLG